MATRKTPDTKKAGTKTGKSKMAVRAPKEPNVSYGKAGKSGADQYTTRGKDTEEFGKGNSRKRLYGYGAQGTPLSAAVQRKRVPTDKPSPGKMKKK